MEEVKTAIDPNPFIQNLGSRLSRRTGILSFLVGHDDVIIDTMFERPTTSGFGVLAFDGGAFLRPLHRPRVGNGRFASGAAHWGRRAAWPGVVARKILGWLQGETGTGWMCVTNRQYP